MGLLDKLWDDTVAGPRPDFGLGKLRKHSTFSSRSSPSKEMDLAIDSGEETTPRVTKSIMIVRPRGFRSADLLRPHLRDPPRPSLHFQEEGKPFDFAECQHPMHARRRVGWEQGDQLLLMMCEL
ncbi:unnamed protein product [Rhodiola kirilowii]